MTKSGLHFPPQWQFYYIHLCIKGKKTFLQCGKAIKKLRKSSYSGILSLHAEHLYHLLKLLPLTPATYIHTQMHTYTSIHKYTNTLGEAKEF